jgi:hypothetical protein
MGISKKVNGLRENPFKSRQKLNGVLEKVMEF